ncbi:hypothetical protein CA51_01250 [Rosistilla oblonga]|nr:hypothetical protein CA51_01250 [Rosistilla oblonga]
MPLLAISPLPLETQCQLPGPPSSENPDFCEPPPAAASLLDRRRTEQLRLGTADPSGNGGHYGTIAPRKSEMGDRIGGKHCLSRGIDGNLPRKRGHSEASRTRRVTTSRNVPV